MVRLERKSGFTLIELVMVIVILGILSAIAIPKFADLTTQAKISATKGGLGAIRSAVAIDYAKSATSGAALFPAAVTTALFADGLIPKNALNGATNVGIVAAVPTASATSADGWWYISATANASYGRVGAYSDGTQDTSTW